MPESSYTPPTGFCAYPSKPASIGEIFRRAAEEITRSRQAKLRTWEGLSVGGKIIIDEIVRAIDQRDMVLADLTGLSPNVLFELGYAVAQNKRIWLLLDTSIKAAKADFEQLRLLTTVGYTHYTNADHVVRNFFKDNPHNDLNNTIFERFIKATLGSTNDRKLLYLKSLWETEAGTYITKRVSKSAAKVIIDDPDESAFQTLEWYGQSTYNAAGVITHFTSLTRHGARVHNAKQALVSGMAYGFAKPLLMVADEDYLSPIDYRDLLKNYNSATQAGQLVDEWLRPIEADHLESLKHKVVHAEAVKLATELSAFQLGLGDYLAENEEETLGEYFVETSAYKEALEGRQTIFIGRKGTGKTANLVKLSSTLEQNPDNLVVKITPAAYELNTLVSLFTKLQATDQKGYVVESLWKFLIYSEIAHAAVRKIASRPIWQIATEHEKELVRLLDQEASVISGDFSVRLERAAKSLLRIKEEAGVEETRLAVSEALHQSVIGKLRVVLGNVLQSKSRVAVLVDNLDKSWSKQADVEQLSQFLLGLLVASTRIAADFRKEDPRRHAVNLTLALFMRADIFARVSEKADEPDKIFYTRLSWEDPGLLFRVIEERYEASHPDSSGEELWNKYFCKSIHGVPTKNYLISRILPRPRDIVYLVKAAVSNAVNRRHATVQQDDILDAEPSYSLYAGKSILVENGVSLPELEKILFEFAGSNAVLSEHEVRALVLKGLGDKERLDYAVNHLIGLGFLGVEIRESQFDFVEDYGEFKKSPVMARRLRSSRGAPQRLKVNPAFHAYLEIVDSL